MNNNGEGTSTQMISPQSNAVGICALVFSILGLFFLTILFVPIAIVLSTIALVKKQYVWGVSALIICIIAIYTSPMFWLLFASFGLR